MSFSESDLRDIQRKIGLGSNEHSEILKLIPDHMLTNNKNGAFCDLTKLDDDVLLSIQNFVNFLRTTTSGWHSTIGNCITSVMMQRHGQ
jgi:hypothetical protein